MRFGSLESHSRRRRNGVTFTEVMFAVVLLGIGFIMVAAIFPVAIRQSQSNLEETAGMAAAKRGAAMMQQMGTSLGKFNPAGLAATPPAPYELIQDNMLHTFG